MKTIEQITKMIESAREDLKHSNRGIARKSADIGKLKTVKMFLESNPDENRVKMQLDNVIARIEIIKARCETATRSMNPIQSKAFEKKYFNQMDMDKLNDYRTTLEFIYND